MELFQVNFKIDEKQDRNIVKVATKKKYPKETSLMP